MNPEHTNSSPTLTEDHRGPCVLRGQVWLTLQTRQAQQLVRGRNGSMKKPAITGLLGFAHQLRVIWQGARNDDPYADWWLIKIHSALDSVSQLVTKQQAERGAQLDQMSAIEVAVAASSRPVRVPLHFANPYAYRAAGLIAEYDALVCTVLTGIHVGLFEGDTVDGSLKLCARKIRGVLALPQRYRVLGLNRDSVRTGAGQAAKAIELMGTVPDDILHGERHALLVPRHLKLQKHSVNPANTQNNDG